MALQGSGQISLADIGTEFGDTKPYSMSEYYKGGALVPDVPTNNNISSSGAISLGGFYNAVKQWTTSWSTAWNTSATTSQTTTTAWSTAWSTAAVITEGPYYNSSSYYWLSAVWYMLDASFRPIGGGTRGEFVWNGTTIFSSNAAPPTSYSINGYTYYKGSFVYSTGLVQTGYFVENRGYYQIYRTYNGSITTSVATSQSTSTAWSTAWSTSQTTSKLTP